MDNEMTNDEAEEILKSLEARRKLIRTIREDYMWTGNYIWTMIISGCAILFYVIVSIALVSYFSIDFSANPIIFLLFFLVPFMSLPLSSRMSYLEKRLKSLVTLMESEHFFDAKYQNQKDKSSEHDEPRQ